MIEINVEIGFNSIFVIEGNVVDDFLNIIVEVIVI